MEIQTNLVCYSLKRIMQQCLFWLLKLEHALQICCKRGACSLLLAWGSRVASNPSVFL